MGDIRAMVPARKAVWSLPGESKASGKTFFFPYFCMLYSYIISLDYYFHNFCFSLLHVHF